jgi:parvulin-like peptidyl-prolyl isomerase
MIAAVRVGRWLPAVGLVVAAGGCATPEPGMTVAPGPMPAWMSTPTAKPSEAAIPAKPADPAPAARGQAPDGGPKAPEGPLTVEPIPAPPAAPPVTTTTVPASYTPAPSAAGVDGLRERQVRIAAYIGTATVITDDEVWSMVRQRGREYADLLGPELEAKQKRMYREELRRLIERELVILEMLTRLRKNMGPGADAQIEKMTGQAKGDADRITATVQKMNKIPTEEDFARVLKAQGITLKGFKRQHERESLKNMYLRSILADKEKFVTLNDLWDYYTAHPKEFAVDDSVKWLDLFVAFNRFKSEDDAKAYADTVWRQAVAGTDFVSLVKQYGQGDSNLRDGEGVGNKRGEVQPPELEGTLMEMDAGHLSPLLRTATGYHIVKVTERRKAGVKPFDQAVQTEIREKLVSTIREREYRTLVDELWRKYRPKAVEE